LRLIERETHQRGIIFQTITRRLPCPAQSSHSCREALVGIGLVAKERVERRLLYVAMTRAKDTLHLVVPHRFFTHGQNAQGDRHVYASRTRFIPAAVMQHFECTTWPPATVAAGGRQDVRHVRVDVGAKMRGMWR
jgi:DNA helicase II / ATP-dependent DNA helicase PcrA